MWITIWALIVYNLLLSWHMRKINDKLERHLRQYHREAQRIFNQSNRRSIFVEYRLRILEDPEDKGIKRAFERAKQD